MSTESSSSNNGKTIAIISYITLIGWIIALIMHMGNKTKLGAFHVRQMLGFMICGIIFQIVVVVLSIILAAIGSALLAKIFGIIVLIVWIGFLILWVLGLIAAIKGEEKPMPVIGAKIQSILGGLFN